MAHIVFWKGCPVKVLKEFEGTGQYSIEVCIPDQIPYHLIVDKSETTISHSDVPTLKPWMITIIQRLVSDEQEKLMMPDGVRLKINNMIRNGDMLGANDEAEKYINAAKKDANNKFTEVGKIKQIIKTLDEISEAYIKHSIS